LTGAVHGAVQFGFLNKNLTKFHKLIENFKACGERKFEFLAKFFLKLKMLFFSKNY